jgi:excisionase family DNA binding protein
MAQEVLTAKQAAELLQTSRDTLIRKARAGVIPAAKLGREWRFRRAELDAWLAAGGERYEDVVDRGLLEVTRERMATKTKGVPLSEVKARYGL